MTRFRSVALLVVSVGLAWPAPAHADAVTDWNATTLLYVAGGPGTPPSPPAGRAGPPGQLDIAIVHLAIHDAVQAIEGRYQPYFYSDPSRFGLGESAAAVAAAAHRMLVLLYPSQSGPLDTLYNSYLTTHGLVGDPGLATGEASAAALFPHRRAPISVPPYFGVAETGQWRSANAMAFLELAFQEPYALNRIDQFRPQPPPPLTSTKYLREFDEAKAKGRGAAHPNANTEMTRFWSVNFAAQWNEAIRNIANLHVADISESARLFALANLAAADSAMAVWESKYFYNFWRPSTAIHEGDTDGNAKTVGDVAWTGLLADPLYPEYVSGANGLTGAYTELLTLYFGGDTFSFSVRTSSPLVADNERDYTSFSQAASEVVEARINQGIHFRSADEEGRRLGNRVAHWVFMKFLRPVPGAR